MSILAYWIPGKAAAKPLLSLKRVSSSQAQLTQLKRTEILSKNVQIVQAPGAPKYYQQFANLKW